MSTHLTTHGHTCEPACKGAPFGLLRNFATRSANPFRAGGRCGAVQLDRQIADHDFRPPKEAIVDTQDRSDLAEFDARAAGEEHDGSNELEPYLYEEEIDRIIAQALDLQWDRDAPEMERALRPELEQRRQERNER